jgi:hypothetical protein
MVPATQRVGIENTSRNSARRRVTHHDAVACSVSSLPVSRKMTHVPEKHSRLDEILHGASDRVKGCVQISENSFRLRSKIVGSDSLVIKAKCSLAGDKILRRKQVPLVLTHFRPFMTHRGSLRGPLIQ